MSTPFLVAFTESVVARLLTERRMEIAPGAEGRVVLYVANRLGSAAPGSSLLSSMEAALLACPEVVELHVDLDDLKDVVDDLGDRRYDRGVRSPLRSLPLVAWSSRFDRGEVTLAGRLAQARPWAGVEPPVTLPAGAVRVLLTFRGGPEPAVDELTIEAGDVRVLVVDGVAQVDGALRTPTHPVEAVAALLDELEDPVITVRARAPAGLLIKLAPGITATIPAGSEIALEAHTSGPADKPRLRHPLVVSVDGAGLSIRLPGARWVTALRAVAIRRASLAPDGAVELHGHAPPPFSHAVGAGLRHASHHLSEMVRNSPRFAGVREFLKS